MAEIKLKDFVDEDSLKKLEELDNKITEVAENYKGAVAELAKGINLEIKVKGDADKLANIYTEQSKAASAASGNLTEALKKQAAVAEQLTQRLADKAEKQRLSAKEAKEMAKASAEVSKSLQQTAKAEEAMHKAEKAAASVRRNTVKTEEERMEVIREALEISDKEVHSIAEATEANKRMRQAVKLLRDTDEDYAETLGKLNATIGVNADYVKRNSDRYVQQKMTIGDYKEQVKRAWMEVQTGNGKMKNMGIIASNVGGILRSRLASGMREVTDGVADMVKGFVGAQAIIGAVQRLLSLLGGGAKSIVSFEAENSKLAAILGTTSDKVKELTVDAQRLGATTKYTASQATELQIELAKLGFTRTEILQTTESVLKFAQATGSELGEAAALAGAAIRMFGATTKESERYVSAMAVSTTKSALSFSYLATALPIVGPVAKAFNFTIEDTLALVGKLADSGFDASMAATATRNIFLNLADSSGKLAKALGKPVTNIDDLVSGLVTLRDRGVDLNTTLELTDKRSVAAFNAFLTAADKVSVLREQITGVDKELGDMASTMGDNVQGAIYGLESAWESVMLSFSKSKGVVKDAIDFLSRGLRFAANELKDFEQRQAEADNAASNKAQKELGDSDYLQKNVDNMKRLYKEYLDSGMKADEAAAKAKSEYIQTLRSRLEIENGEYDAAVKKRKDLEHELDDRGFMETLLSWRRTGKKIKGEIEDAMTAAAGKKGLASITESVIGDLEKVELLDKKSGQTPLKVLSDEQKKAILNAETALQESKAKLMDEGYDKEVASIRAGYEKRIKAIKGDNDAEIQLRISLQKEMEDAVSDFTEKYILSKSKGDLENRLAYAKKQSEEELAIRLQLLEVEMEEEVKAAEKTGVEVSLIKRKYESQRQEILGEYAKVDIDNLSKNAAAEQLVRNEAFNIEMRELERNYAEGLIRKEDYERKKAEMTEAYAIESARAAVELLEKQLAVSDIDPTDRKELTAELQKAKADLADKEADAEIASIKRVEEAEKASYQRRIAKAQQWLDVVGGAFEKISGLADSLMEAEIQRVEEQQDMNDESYEQEIERIEKLEENGVITKEQAEARKRAAEEKTAKKTKQLEEEKKKIQIKQAKWQKANGIIQAGIATALGIMQALAMYPPNIPLAAVVAAMGAVQTATIAASPIPAYKEGTKGNGHEGGPALVGDGGRKEVVVYKGMAWLTPDKPTFVNLPKGAEVIPSVDKYVGSIDFAPGTERRDSRPVIVNNDYSSLERKVERSNYLLQKALMMSRRNSESISYELFKQRRI